MKLNWQGVIAIIILVVSVTLFIIYKRDYKKLEDSVIDRIESEKLYWKGEMDSLSISYDQLIEEQDGKLKKKDMQLAERLDNLKELQNRNNMLNNKLKNYEKNLPYTSRGLDSALNILSKYRYQGNTRTTGVN